MGIDIWSFVENSRFQHISPFCDSLFTNNLSQS